MNSDRITKHEDAFFEHLIEIAAEDDGKSFIEEAKALNADEDFRIPEKLDASLKKDISHTLNAQKRKARLRIFKKVINIAAAFLLTFTFTMILLVSTVDPVRAYVEKLFLMRSDMDEGIIFHPSDVKLPPDHNSHLALTPTWLPDGFDITNADIKLGFNTPSLTYTGKGTQKVTFRSMPAGSALAVLGSDYSENSYTVNINGFEGTVIPADNNDTALIWMDSKLLGTYMIDASGIAVEDVIKIAESCYNSTSKPMSYTDILHSVEPSWLPDEYELSHDRNLNATDSGIILRYKNQNKHEITFTSYDLMTGMSINREATLVYTVDVCGFDATVVSNRDSNHVNVIWLDTELLCFFSVKAYDITTPTLVKIARSCYEDVENQSETAQTVEPAWLPDGYKLAHQHDPSADSAGTTITYKNEAEAEITFKSLPSDDTIEIDGEDTEICTDNVGGFEATIIKHLDDNHILVIWIDTEATATYTIESFDVDEDTIINIAKSCYD